MQMLIESDTFTTAQTGSGSGDQAGQHQGDEQNQDQTHHYFNQLNRDIRKTNSKNSMANNT